VDAYAQIGDNVTLEAGVAVGRYAKIDANTRVYPNVTVYHGCEIGQRCIIHAGAVIGSDGFGFAPTPQGWHKIPQVGRVLVGDDVEIGANTAIDRGALTDTVIHNGVKIDNLVHIAHNCVIGSRTAIAGCVGMAGTTEIGESCMIGGGALLGGHLTIADKTIVSGGTAIISDIKTAGQYTGIYPASTHREWERNAPLMRHLADLRKRIRGLEKNADTNQQRND
jgi:UDP-3-O-[3-hydroxymyristoyl] glucosamine N-acyltransferase